MLHPARDDFTLGYLSGNSSAQALNLLLTSANYQNSADVTLGIIKAKKLPPPGETL